MAKHHDKVAAEELLPVIESFLSSCRSPAVLEEGDTPIALLPGTYALQLRSRRLFIEASTDLRLLSRQITSVDKPRPGILDCYFHRFGGAEGRITFLDLDRPQTAHRQLNASRKNFGAQFRTMLRRQFPLWDVEVLSSGMDLRRSFSPVFPRATLTRGNQSIAAMACPNAESENELLTFALLWFDHVRQAQTSLCLFLPQGSGCLTAHRLRWLRTGELRPRLFLFNEHGSAGEVDGQDLGNLHTRVGSRFVAPYLPDTLKEVLEKVADFPHTSSVSELSGAISIRFQGVEFARLTDGRLSLGLANQETVSPSEFDSVGEFVSQLQAIQSAPSLPERWLEGVVRAHLQTINPSLRPTPVHGQVLTFAGRDRDSVDLLAVSREGRLTILELKAVEDLHLPMQALDYWMRVKWHAERNELTHLFPDISLSTQSPRLLLVAPALSFHSTNVAVVRYFSPEVEIERIGVNSDWRTQFRVVLRLTGANPPISHGRS